MSARIVIVALALSTWSCAPATEDPVATSSEALSVRKRGALLSAEQLRTLSAEDVEETLEDEGFEASSVLHGVELYRLVYATLDARGQPTRASGLLVLPRVHARELPLVSFTHGTELFKGDVPSYGEDTFLTGAPLTYGSAGYAVAAPDYVGLGVGTGTHPYMHLPSEVSASLDMLRAARSFARWRGKVLSDRVYVTGFSQGALAAIGLGRLLEGSDTGFSLAALAPISGPYQVRKWVRAALAGEVSAKDATMYFAYLSVAWNRIYGLYDAPSTFFRSPYDVQVPPLLDNTHGGEELAAATPDTPLQLLSDVAIARYRDPDPVLAQPIDELSALCSSWTPRAPLRLLGARGDEQVPWWNSEFCQRELNAHGVQTELIDLGEVGHLETNINAPARVLEFFERVHR